DGNGSRLVIGAGEIGRHPAARAEAGVERAIAVVARQNEVEARRAGAGGVGSRIPGGNDSVVRLDGKGKRKGEPLASRARESGSHFATRAEGGVERAIAVVGTQREVSPPAALGFPCGDVLPDRLHRNGRRLGTASETGRYRATCAEAGVERAIAVEASQREVGEEVDVEGRSREDDLPVRLQDNGSHSVKGAREIDRGGHDAARAEAGVERAVGVGAGQGEGDGRGGGEAPRG